MPTPPSILYLTPGCFDKGGISRYNRYQIEAFRDLVGAANVHVFSLLGPANDSFEEPFQTRFFAGGARTADKLRFLAHVSKAAVFERHGLVVAAHVNLSAPARVLARALRMRSVLNIYGSEVWSGFRVDNQWGFAGMDHVIADCHFTARYVETRGHRPQGSTAVVWDCVDLAKFHPGPPSKAVLSKYGIPDPATGKNLLTLGRMSPDAAHKGYERLLDVFQRVAARDPSIRLVYAGRGDMVERLRSRAASLGLGDRVFFTGMVHEADMADVYRSAHIFSLVSDRGVGRGEGIPLTPLEAAACGVPILVGNQDGSVEAVVDDSNGFVLDPFDLDAHAGKVELLASNESLRSAMAGSAAAVARREFCYERFREKHRALLREWFPINS